LVRSDITARRAAGDPHRRPPGERPGAGLAAECAPRSAPGGRRALVRCAPAAVAVRKRPPSLPVDARRLTRLLVPGTVVAAIALVFLPMTPAYDLNVFLRAGQNVAEGLPVYPSIGTPSVYSGAAFVYPYFAAFPFVLLAGLSAPPATWLFFAISGGCVVAVSSVGVAKGHLRALLVLCCAFTITGLQLGALSPLLFAGTLLLWRMRDRPRAFVLAGPIIAAKLFLAPLLLWLLLARRYRAL